MKKKAMLLISLLFILSLSGCSGGGDGGGLDIVKFLQNPIVMVVGGILIAYWMMKRSK